MLISDRVFQILKEKGLSQKEFSELSGIPQSTISDWKRKRVNPAADKIMIICEILDISPSSLLSDSGYSPEHLIVDKADSEYNLINGYRSLDEKQKDRLLGYMQALLEQS